MQQPEYPLLVAYTDGAKDELFNNEIEMVTSLEWFDSNDPEYNAVVIDKRGRKLQLVIRKLELVVLEIAQ